MLWIYYYGLSTRWKIFFQKKHGSYLDYQNIFNSLSDFTHLNFHRFLNFAWLVIFSFLDELWRNDLLFIETVGDKTPVEDSFLGIDESHSILFLDESHHCAAFLVVNFYLLNLSLVLEKSHQFVWLVVVFGNVANVNAVLTLRTRALHLWPLLVFTLIWLGLPSCRRRRWHGDSRRRDIFFGSRRRRRWRKNSSAEDRWCKTCFCR